MPKKIRWPIVVGQIMLFALGIFLILVYYAAYQTMESSGWWYTGPPPGLFLISGIVCVIAAVLLFSVARYEAKED